MKKNLFKRGMAGLLSLVMCLTALVGIGTTTAYAAGERAEVYLVSFPRSGDANIDYSGTWGHPNLRYMNGWHSGESKYTTIRAMHSYDGNICYCIEPGVRQDTGDTYTSKDETFWDNLPSDINSTISPYDMKLFIGRIMQYGYTGPISTSWRSQNPADAATLAQAMATQVLIWETVVGERDEDFNHISPGSYDAVKSVVSTAHPLYSQFISCYNSMEASVQRHSAIPSFMAKTPSKAQSVELAWNSTNYTATLTDSNNVLPDYSFSANEDGISFSVSGNKLTITAATAPSDSVKITASKSGATRRGIITWTDGKFAPGSGIQDVVSYAQEVNDPVQAFLNLKASYGSAKIVKTSEDGKVDNLTFTVTGSGVNQTVKTNAKGEIQIDNLMSGVYTVTEMDYDKYEPQESRRVTVVSGQVSTVNFNNKLKRGDLQIVKSSEDNLNGGVSFHLYGTSLSGIAVDEYARMKDGKRCSGSIPYGYNRLATDKQTLVVDPVASEVVKRIFLLANEGKSPRTIAELLTEEKVLIPAAHAKEYHPEQYNGMKFSDPYLWGMSTIRGILSRQEYLGHTVLRKSVSTNFKLHKRKNTDEDEQYVFYNTHEPFITQELWDSVQKRKKRANRTAAKGTHSNRLSGYLYCADCGRRMTLQTHYSKKDRSVQYSYRCGGYASKVNSCSAHSISADNVEALILSAVKRLSRFVLNDEEAFAKELQALWNEKQIEKPKQNKSELHRFQKRYDELSKLIRGLYENLVSGLLPERQYKQLMKQYDDEQAELETKIEAMQQELTEEKTNTVDIKHFISLIRKCKEPTEISDLMFAELIDKIVVYEAEGVGRARTQKVDIYFNYVGQVDIAYTEEELAEIKVQEEQEEKKRLEKQRKREKAYREKRKAKKIAENGGEIVKTKVCPHCQKEFEPTSNRQIFCSKDCCYQARQDQKKADREAEKGNHYYRQRVCAVCGSTYWPTHSQQKLCSEECQKQNHNEKSLEFYHKKQKEKSKCNDLSQMKEPVSSTNSSEIITIPA